MKNISILDFVAKRAWSKYKAFQGSHKLKKAFKTVSPIRIVIGSSGVFDYAWIPTDIEYFNVLNPNHWKRYF